jgi:phosphoserine phosphatase RsbU/P
VRVSVDDQGDSVLLTVSNEGAPLSPEVLARLFEPLRRGDGKKTHGEHRNLGLGLFIVREIAKAHGGNVFTDVADGRIAFIIRLPKDERP